MKAALTIAGSDPTGGAGIQADIAAFRSFGLMALSAITAVTAQDGERVFIMEPVSVRTLTRQVTALAGPFDIRSVKIGMLANAGNAVAVGKIIKKTGLGNVVLDTVLRSSGGRALLDEKGVEAIRALMPLCRVTTPNMEEAGRIVGMRVIDEASMERAARLIHSMGAPNVLVTGGHLKAAPTDLLYDGKVFARFTGTRVSGGARRLHGTGCMLSAAIAAGLARGRSVKRAIVDAKAYVEEMLKARR